MAGVLAFALMLGGVAANAQSGDTRAQDQSKQPTATTPDAARENQRKIDEFAEAASYAVKDKRLVFVNHAFSKGVKEAMAKDPDGAVLSTHEVARQVLGRL